MPCGALVATHQKTQQGLKLRDLDRAMSIVKVATHQKTQQGLKRRVLFEASGQAVATHQKTQQGLKHVNGTPLKAAPGRNASENPAGIET